jgi:hypothetical protein
LLPEIPKTLKLREVDAIKYGAIYTGMSNAALGFLMGFPEKQSGWGRGGKQLTYSNMFVYLDHAQRVKDWQFIGRN